MASRTPSKRQFIEIWDGNDDGVQKAYRFQILLPNGTSVHLMLDDPEEEMSLDHFVYLIREEIRKSSTSTPEARRKIIWSGDIYLEDMCDMKIRKKICFNRFETNKCHILRLHDGVGESVNTFQNMWDLTPDTELLAELPAEYTFETALADLIDNSLQALWTNGPAERRLVRVEVDKQKIVIFDTGPGMDGSDRKSISRWGKMGASDHRRSRKHGVGGTPPYLMPFFGMYGYGGTIASMHLGRRAIVSSKTKESRKVYTLHLSRDALLSKTTSKCAWQTDGGIRDPSDEEIQMSPHGSFTQVEIHDLKLKCLDIHKLKCLLKDIYFPYIQFDEELTSRKTMMPIEFQMNEINLAEFVSGEVTITNMLSCNGPEFVLQLHFMAGQENTSSSPAPKVCRKANARLRCVYFPIAGGKETIDKILENLVEVNCKIEENFENFSRVSIRRLGRLLPDARWRALPFMEPKLRKGDKAELMKRCCLRVKCFVETDAGFSPTPSKTDLAHHDLFTTALRGLGSRHFEKDSEVVQIFKDGKPLNFLQLEKDYQDWIISMHDKYDEEVDCGEDEPVVVGAFNNKKVGISADVIRVHRAIKRRGFLWKSGQKVKILKGAVGCSKNNLYATLEFILLQGFQGDVGGEARLICRPLGYSDDKGCSIEVIDGMAQLDIRDSLSFPISVIDTGKFEAIDNFIWDNQVQKHKGKAPSTIDVLRLEQCNQLGIDEELPLEVPVDAGYKPPNEIIAVIRPASFCSSSSNSLDQKYIFKSDIEMSMQVRLMHGGKNNREGEFIQSERVKPSSRHGLHGLYVFSMCCRQNRFCKAGVYCFTFSAICEDAICQREIRMTIRPASSVGKWSFLGDDHSPLDAMSSISSRVGGTVPRLSVGFFDPYLNQIPFSSVPEVKINIETDTHVFGNVDKFNIVLSDDRLSLEITDLLIESSDLDRIRPGYKATLKIYQVDANFSAAIRCRVMPGPPLFVMMQYSQLRGESFTPGYVIHDLVLEIMDNYRNHIEEGAEVTVKLDGLCFVDHGSYVRKVNEHGYVNLSSLLKVKASYGSQAILSILVADKMIFKNIFEVEKRELKIVSRVPNSCIAGSDLKKVIFEVVDSNGAIDVSINGRHHTLSITSDAKVDSSTVLYTFEQGRCIVPVVSIPQEPGPIRFLASHTYYPDLQINFETCVLQAPKLEMTTVTHTEASPSQSQSSDNKIFLLQNSSPCTSRQLVLFETILDDARILEENIAELGRRIADFENNLKVLNTEKSGIGQEINDLQAQIGPEHSNHTDMLVNTKEKIVKEIQKKGNTPASVLCNLANALDISDSGKNFVQDIIGVVALIGSVRDSKISRILSEYLGEEYMLAIVCKSYEGAFAMEEYDNDGKVNRSCALHEAAATLSMKLDGRFPVICLEEIRPYMGKLVGNKGETKLDLPLPSLSGKLPGGFVGYAVNMINIDLQHQETLTARGYGLRETLFYQLFGEVQVYETRADMIRANSCIQHGAVSLDGGIMRDKGLILLGEWEPAIRFPVIAPQVQRALTRCTINLLKEIEEKKALLAFVDEQIQETVEARAKDLKKFKKKSERFNKMLGGIPSPGDLLLKLPFPRHKLFLSASP